MLAPNSAENEGAEVEIMGLEQGEIAL